MQSLVNTLVKTIFAHLQAHIRHIRTVPDVMLTTAL